MNRVLAFCLEFIYLSYTHETGQLTSENKLITDFILALVSRFTTCMAELLLLQRKHLAYRSSEGCPAQGIPSATRTMILSFAMSFQFQQSIVSNHCRLALSAKTEIREYLMVSESNAGRRRTCR